MLLHGPVFHPFLLLSGFHWMAVPQFVYPFTINEHFGSFHCGEIMMKAAMLVFLPFFFFKFSFCFLGLWRFPGWGSIQSYSHWPIPQQRGIQASSATYTKAHNTTRSPTHWVRLGIKPTTSEIQVRSISTVPQWELIMQFFLQTCIFSSFSWVTT